MGEDRGGTVQFPTIDTIPAQGEVRIDMDGKPPELERVRFCAVTSEAVYNWTRWMSVEDLPARLRWIDLLALGEAE